MNLDTLIWRWRILRSKTKGQLPALPWNHLPELLAQPFEKWDFSSFVTSVTAGEVPGMAVFETAIGRFYGRPEDRVSIGESGHAGENSEHALP